jgi:hypothetical protein
MQYNKLLLNIAPSALAAMLVVTASNRVLASNQELNGDEGSEPTFFTVSNALSGLSLEDLQRKLEEEEALNEEIFIQKIAEQEKKEEVVRKILEARATREILLSVSVNPIPQSVESSSATAVSQVEQEFEKQKQVTVEQATREYEILLGEKIGSALQSHFGPETDPSRRQSLGLAWEGFVKTLPLIAKYCTGILPWRDSGEEWFEVVKAHAYDNGGVVKHGRANGLYNGQRPGRKQDHFDSLQLVIDCWNSNQGYHSPGILRYALALDSKALVGQTKEAFVEAAVAQWMSSRS